MSEPDGSLKRLLIEYVLPPEVASPGAEVDVAELGIEVSGFTVDPAPGPVSVSESRHGPLILIRGVADDVASVGSNPNVVGVWLDKSPTATDDTTGASDAAPEWDDPDVEGPERYLF